ncbi:ATP-binding protein [Desulfolutivibrio sp.]|uniref:ATP-binding protein n=1 Tax=Desulfolutivibrio sp. TaxID=2773296 RepID=UPI002F96B1DB
MTLDIRTLFLVYSIAMAVSAAVFLGLYRIRFADKSPLAWGLGSAAITLGFLLIFLRGVIPAFVSIVMANMCIVFGHGMFLCGIRLLMGRPSWCLPVAIVPCLMAPLLAWFTYVDPSLPIRILIVRLFICIVSVLIWRELAVAKPMRPGRPQRVVAGVYALEGAITFFSAVIAPFTETRIDFFHASAFNSAFLVLANVFILVNSLAMVVLYGEHYRQKLSAARDAAEAASRTKSRFLAHMSHELRTPLNGLMGMLELSRDAETEAKRREFLDIAASSAQGLLTIINDILDLSRLEAGKLAVSPEPFALAPALDAVLAPFARMAQAQGLGFAVRVVPDDVRIEADATRLRQIVLNLVGNALKFTGRGRIDVEARVSPAAPGEGRLTLCVADTGCGIPADMLEQIFENFSQADAGAQKGGTGLGLTISRQLARLLGGELTVSSVAGEGSRFCLDMPCRVLDPAVCGTPPDPEAPAVDLAGQPGMRVLVADDFEPNRLILAIQLKKAGHHVVEAADGEAAVQAVAAVGATAFDLVLMDVGMPVLDGLSATRRIRAVSGAHPPIVAVTAAALPGDRERCLEAGMDDYLTKPLRPGDLHRVLRRFAPQGPPRPAAWAAGLAPAPSASFSGATHIDWVSALEYAGGRMEDLEMLCGVVDEFIAEERAALHAETAAGALDALPDRLHSLRPTLAGFGAAGLAALTWNMERAAREGRREDIPGLAVELEKGLAAFLAELNARRPLAPDRP